MSRKPSRSALRPAAGTEARLPWEPRVLRRPSARRFTPRTEGSPGAHKAAACTAPPGGSRPHQRRIRPPGRGYPAPPLRRSRKAQRLPSPPEPPEPPRLRWRRAWRGPCEWVPEPERRTGKRPGMRGGRPRGCYGDAGRRRPRAALPPPWGRRCNLLAAAASWAPRGAAGELAGSESSCCRAGGTPSGCGPEVARGWGPIFSPECGRGVRIGIGLEARLAQTPPPPSFRGPPRGPGLCVVLMSGMM